MNTPKQSDPRALIDAYIDDVLDDAGFAELCDWLRAEVENRREFARALALHSGIADWSSDHTGGLLIPEFSKATQPDGAEAEADWLGALADLDDDRGLPQPIDITEEIERRDLAMQRRKRSATAGADDAAQVARVIVVPRVVVWLAGVAAILLLTLVFWPEAPTPQGPGPVAQDPAIQPPAAEAPAVEPPASVPVEPRVPVAAVPVAQLVGSVHARWQTDQGPIDLPVGADLLPGRRLTLTEGFAQLRTRQGALAILEAPCTIEFTDSDNALRLLEGKLVGVCQVPSSRGFTVHTPAGAVVDVGTRFGVMHDGVTRTRVIEGEVHVSALAGGPEALPTALVAGQSASVDAGAGRVIVAAIADPQFVTHWGAISNPPRVEGQIRFERAMPTAFGLGESESDGIQLYLERSGLRLADDAEVTLARPGTYEAFAGLSSRVPAGTAVDSYFIHLDTPGQLPLGGVASRRATIRFDRPIVGVIAASDQLAESHAVFGLPGVKYGSMDPRSLVDGKQSSGVEASVISAELGDMIYLSEDRRTLTMQLNTQDAIDQFRVLVASQDIAP